MARMVRKQIVIEERQNRALEERARTLGVSQSALVREGIDLVLSGARGDARRARALKELFASLDEARVQGVGSYGRKWTREELHER